MSTAELFETRTRLLTTRNGESFENHPELKDLWLKTKSAMHIYNVIIRRPLSEQNNFFEMAKEGIIKLVGYEGNDLTLETLLKYIESLNVHLGMFIYDKKRLFLGPNVSAARGFVHADIAKSILTVASKTQATISGYSIIHPLEIGGEKVEGIFFADKDISNGHCMIIEDSNLANHPLCLLELKEGNEIRYFLFATSENEPLRFKRPIK